eukprot:Rmarinus@m.17603
MSLFKVRDWWTTKVGEEEEFDIGSICVGNVDNNPDGATKVVVGSFQGFLRVYLPRNGEFRVEDLLFEKDLEQPILQVEIGQFLSNSKELALAVLFPRFLHVYTLQSEGKSSYFNLSKAYEHTFSRSAFNFTYGSFGGAQGRDYICVQSLDGLLQFYETDTFAFSRFLSNFLIPGPLVYCATSDTFITANSQMDVECYKYQVLAASSEEKEDPSTQGGLRAVKKVQSDWTVNFGDQVIDIKIGRFGRPANGPRDIIVLGEHGLMTISDQGSVRIQKRLDFHPISMSVYPANGNEENPPDNLLIATHTASLMVYDATRLLWAAKLNAPALHASVNSFSGLKGLMVTMDGTGQLSVNYLGTEPAVSSLGFAVDGKELNYEEMDEEHRQLLSVIKEATSEHKSEPTDRIVIRATVPARLDQGSQGQARFTGVEGAADDYESAEAMGTVTAPLYVSYTGTGTIDTVSITISAPPPFAVKEPHVTIRSVGGGNRTPTIVPLTFVCRSSELPSTMDVAAVASYQAPSGEPRTATCDITLPLCLVCRSVPPVKNPQHKVTVEVQGPEETLARIPPIPEIFADVVDSGAGGDGSRSGANVVTLQYIRNGVDASVLLSKKEGVKFRVQGSQFAGLWPIVDQLILRLKSMLSAAGCTFSIMDPLPLGSYASVIEEHFKLRQELEENHKALASRSHQFRAMEKRLIVRFKDKNPSSLNNLDKLLLDTHGEIMDTANNIMSLEKQLAIASNNLSCSTNLFLMMLRYRAKIDDASYDLLKNYWSSEVCDNTEQGWEEVTDASLAHLLKTSLAKSSKESAPVTQTIGPMKDISKLTKHMKTVCDRVIQMPSFASQEPAQLAERKVKKSTTTLSSPKESAAVMPKGSSLRDKDAAS